MKVLEMTPTEIRRKGLAVLSQRLGPVGMVRFLQQFEKGSGDYTQARREWLQGLTVQQIVEEVKRKTRPPSR